MDNRLNIEVLYTLLKLYDVSPMIFSLEVLIAKSVKIKVNIFNIIKIEKLKISFKKYQITSQYSLRVAIV